MTTSIDNRQPSLAVTRAIVTDGPYPYPYDGVTVANLIGFVFDFAGNFAPVGTLLADGRSVVASVEQPLSTVLGTTYGGGSGSFNLPNLTGRVIIGTGPGNPLGAATGSADITLSTAQLPPPQGSGQPFSNVQPSLPLQTLICTIGPFPISGDRSLGAATFVGEIANFTGNGPVPYGWLSANGQIVRVNDYPSLYTVIGNIYGGDGITTFALPNLQGVVAVGASPAHSIGASFGEAATTLTSSELPPGGAPVNNDQPSLAIEYLVGTYGGYPVSSGLGGLSDTSAMLGQIVEFAGGYVPSGYALANGQLLPIKGNEALYSILWTTYGGDGKTTFALPDFTGRAAIGAGGTDTILGTSSEFDTFALTSDEMPCFLAGTRIATETGEAAVEDLAVGDRVLTASGRTRTVRWIGHRAYAGRFLKGNPTLLPIRFRAGSLGDGLPRRDLLVSRQHAMFLDGVLIPAHLLVNGRSIVTAGPAAEVRYFHVELDSHDVLLAEGAPAESFLDCGNRRQFRNAHQSPESPGEIACAERVVDGRALMMVRARLAKVADTLVQHGRRSCAA